MWNFQALPLEGAFLITLPEFEDNRGLFIKAYQEGIFKSQGIAFELKESYCSVSRKDVIRGMHFQLPPYDHSKIVFCPQGSILDVIVDLRKDAPTYGQYHAEVLSAENHRAFFIPKGFAHGFKSLEDHSITYYLVSSEHNSTADAGILYNSFGMDWQTAQPILSERDLTFKSLEAFLSPF